MRRHSTVRRMITTSIAGFAAASAINLLTKNRSNSPASTPEMGPKMDVMFKNGSGIED